MAAVAASLPRSWPALRLALLAGLLAGIAELAYVGVRKFLFHLLLFQSGDPNSFWLAPAVNAALFVAVAGLLVLLGRRWDRLGRPGVVAGVSAFLLVTSMLQLSPRIHPVASLLLAAGVAYQVARRYARWGPAMDRVAVRTLPWGLGAMTLLALGVPAAQLLVRIGAERRLPAARAGAPNVLLIILDTVRSMNLSLYGYGLRTTPLLERWAATGVRFDRALSPAPWTLPAHASLFTGRDAHELSASWQTPLDGASPTLAEAFRDFGYRTGGFVGNASYCNRGTGLARGFLVYEDYAMDWGRALTSAALLRAVLGPRSVRKVLVGGDMLGRKNATTVSRSFLDWLERDHARPFFAFLNYYDAHVPYLPPEPYRSRFLRAGDRLQANLIRQPGDDRRWSDAEIRGLMSAYDGALAYLDAELDRLFAELESRGLLRNTLVVVTSDHGEEFNEHGLILHGNSLYRASLQVPLVLLWPGHLPAGKVVLEPVTTRDLPATILDLLQLRPTRPLPGTSLARVWTDSTSRTGDRPLINSVRRAWQVPSWYPVAIGDMMSVVWRGHRLIRGGDGKEALYDFDRDPEERHDLLKDPGTAELAGPLRARLDSAAARVLRSP